MDDGIGLSKDNAVAQQLLTSNAPPPSFELIETVMLKFGPTDDDVAIFARLFRVRRPEAVVPGASTSSSTAITAGLDAAAGSVR